jgi:tRNA1(Val) A37 N6-methylase TrmN6
MSEAAEAVTEDRILGGRLILRQPAKGYRAGMDAALLAAACDAEAGARVIEPGCGVGAVLLAAAARRPGAHFVGIERDPGLVALAQANIAANRLESRVEAAVGEVGGKAVGRGFDAALANPPFFDDPGALRAPHPAKAGAWMAEGGFEAWAAFLLAAVRDGGTITVIHRADRLAEILAALGPKAGSFQVLGVHPFVDEAAKRVLVRALRGGRAPLQLLPPLVLHDRAGGKHTPAAEAILRGEAALAWR